MMRASDISPRMFDNDFLDFFSRTHWLTVPIVWLPLSGLCFWLSVSAGQGVLATAGLWLLGLFTWSLSEYWLHRTLFHWTPPGPWGAKIHFVLHGVHHQWHQDPYRLVMPPAVSLVLGAGLWGVMWAVEALLALVGVPPVWHFGFFSGFIVGYVAYDCTHYYLHHFRPTSLYAKRLRAHHMSHHHNDPDRKFGVSSFVWDKVFGTF